MGNIEIENVHHADIYIYQLEYESVERFFITGIVRQAERTITMNILTGVRPPPKEMIILHSVRMVRHPRGTENSLLSLNVVMLENKATRSKRPFICKIISTPRVEHT